MPVDFVAVFLPLAILGLVVSSFVTKSYRRFLLGSACVCLCAIVCIYIAPGWYYYWRARSGNADAQFKLGMHYGTRMGYMWADVESRDKWWLLAAKQGHPDAMKRVGYLSLYGTSNYIVKDLKAARYWLDRAKQAGDPDTEGGFKTLEWLERGREKGTF